MANGTGEALTVREQDILALVCEGLSNAEIAALSHISEATVKTHLRRIFIKMGVSSRAQLVANARRGDVGTIRRAEIKMPRFGFRRPSKLAGFALALAGVGAVAAVVFGGIQTPMQVMLFLLVSAAALLRSVEARLLGAVLGAVVVTTAICMMLTGLNYQAPWTFLMTSPLWLALVQLPPTLLVGLDAVRNYRSLRGRAES